MPNAQQLEALGKRIRAARRLGITTVAFRPRAAETELLTDIDGMISDLGFIPIGDDWMPVEPGAAYNQAVRLLHRDLAYGGEVTYEPLANELGFEFVRVFGPAGHFFTNMEPGGGWPLSESTFDEGLVGVGGGWLGLLCVQDED